MYDLGNGVLSVVMVIASMWIVNRFWGIFFEKKKNSPLFLAVWSLFFIFQMLIQCNRWNADFGMICINSLLIFLIVITGYICAGKEKYFLLVLLCTIWSLIEIVVFFLLSNVQIGLENQDLMGAAISKLFMIIIIYVMSVCWGKNRGEYLPNIIYFYLLFIQAGSIFIAIWEFYSQNDRVSPILITSTLLIINIVIFELNMKMNAFFMYEKEKTVHAQHLGIVSGNTAEQKKIMEDFHQEKHNLMNELIVLKAGIERGDKDSVIQDLNKIINNCHNAESISDSGNNTVDAIINFKYAVASEYGIAFRLKLFIPDELPVEQCDIGVVLGNAIDNAIEAVNRYKKKEKIIEISMGVKKGAWVMVIKNPYEHEIKKDRAGRILSTKPEKHKHGYGLRSIMKIAEEYQGDMVIDTENGIFSLTVVLNLKDF